MVIASIAAQGRVRCMQWGSLPRQDLVEFVALNGATVRLL
jgi:hypothetical protein